MIVFLTSSPSGPLDVPNEGHLLDSKNHFVDNLRKYWEPEMKGLIIAAFPMNYKENDEMMHFFSDAFSNANLPIQFDLWDGRICFCNIHDYQFIMLAGGHVPTQNAYFKKIQLRQLMQNYKGIVLGVSAGSMNSANIVYAQPELEGESRLDFCRFLEGLNLTDLNVLPHYQMVKKYTLDGKRLFEDITYLDSQNRMFYCLVDGSYFLIENHKTYLYGEAYLLKDGLLQIINTHNSVIEIK